MDRVLFRLHPGHLPAGGQAVPQAGADGFAVRGSWPTGKQRVRQAWPKVSLRLLVDASPDLPRGETLRLKVLRRA